MNASPPVNPRPICLLALVLAFSVPAAADFGDQRVWIVNGDESWDTSIFLPGQTWRIVGAGDVNGDGVSDLVWRDSATGAVAVAVSHHDELYPLQAAPPIPVATMSDLSWEIVGVADLDADGRADLVWLNRITQQVAVWLMRGTTIARAYLMEYSLVQPPPGSRWRLLAAVDVSGNGQGDLVWVLY